LDEGGPLVCGGELTGILSLSVNCGNQNKPSIYTEVAIHKSWIENIIGSAAVNGLSFFSTIAMLTALTSFWHCGT
jgi:secreted trypsin-like serine protease